ncbi:helix-turn-helix domain-containing protein [Saccharopolyspora sp. HNM0983]|uniref:Helix-turn-helix domain-containing protein n=1 Tax=Saccharopolyspora montiporae TaxID=2781240 RepID=A0A929B8Z1_9PSEU|nr:helix-turn-helix transcriptional regulator [Saccharopolyspora sp. HNM0983]MBE9373753.1 helix-turn-helix domain-containing protein [Saccharopolyspora sp. HNM0983]
MSSSKSPRSELGEFLKARRAELGPHQVGLPDTGAVRRVPGLRREEVAQLAAISTDYYTRLEQGRIAASASVLGALARVLHLDDDQRDYLSELAGKEAVRPRRRTRQTVRVPLQRLLDDLRFTPAFVLGRRMDVLAWNPLAAALVTDFGQIPARNRNYVRLLFTDPAMRRLYADWETVAHTCVALLRREAARCPDDPQLAELVGELSVRDADFRQWWAAHHVANQRIGTKTLHHPVVGDLTLDWDTLTSATDPDQQLITWSAEPGTPAHDRLRILASWAAEQGQPDTADEPRS